MGSPADSTDFLLHPIRSCFAALAGLVVLGGVFYYTSTDSDNPSRSDRIDELVADSQSLESVLGQFDSENWQDVVPNVRHLAGAVAANAYALKREDHWYKDSWAIAAIIIGVLLILAQRTVDTLEKKLKELEQPDQ